MVYRNKIVEPSYKDQAPVRIDDRVCALSPDEVPDIPPELDEQISKKLDLVLGMLEA